MSADTVPKNSTTYPPMTPAERAAALGVRLSQRNKLDLSAAVPNRFITLEEALAYNESWYWDGTIGACRLGHISARRVSNKRICADCERVKAGELPLYGKSLTQKYYDKPRKPDPAAVVIAAPIAQPAQIEPTKKEQDFLAAVAEHRDLDKAAAAVGWSRALADARVSVNEVFATALNGLCDRLQVPRTLKAPSTFPWTDEVKRNLINHFIDSGLMSAAREAVGVSASEFFARIESDPGFAAAVEAARPLAALTLIDRATQAAAVGKIDLLKYLEASAPKDDLSNLSHDQINEEIRRLVRRFADQGLIDTRMRHRVTGEVIHLKDFDDISEDSSNADLVS